MSACGIAGWMGGDITECHQHLSESLDHVCELSDYGGALVDWS